MIVPSAKTKLKINLSPKLTKNQLLSDYPPFAESKFKIKTLSDVDKLLVEREALALTYIIEGIYQKYGF